ncbi:MAG: Asp-tRNA(Asn)/Glu-tRNA(Gln) amidotransferase GatCAB subunit B, partial [Dehalococcoidales bacterium]|nr:Asp-tRNA(Asn)/Glu-tRNA(Gln) amidotransferase GatCAB subunit B [Dehalococcoidales bacterium]
IRARLPEMPAVKAERFMKTYGLTGEEAVIASADHEISTYFEAVVKEGAAARTTVHWLNTQLLPAVRERNQELSDSPVTAGRFAGLLKMLASDEINANAARDVLTQLFESDESPEAIVEARGFKQVSDTGELDALIEKVIEAQPSAVTDFRNGQGKAIGFLVGQVMQASGGKANPKIIRELLTKKLG